MHICRRWRCLVFSYQRSLQLRLFCTHGTPARKTLDCWPRALPIVVAYGGSSGLDPPTLEDENDIMAALKQPDRVHSISLTITNSLLEKLSAIRRPFWKLEDLILVSRDDVQLTLPNAFRWGQRLRRLRSTRIVIPALVQLRYLSMDLIDLRLHEVPNPWNFSPNTLPDTLSRLVQLRSLSLHFLSTSDHAAISPPSLNRVVLPALTRLKYRGIARDLEDLMVRIDAPHLKDIEITFSHESITNLSKNIGFISRLHKSHRQVHILSSQNAISVSLTQPKGPTRIKFRSFCKSFSLQLSLLDQISALLFGVEDLHINVTRQSRQKASSYTGRWLKLLNLFSGVKWLHVAGNFSTDIVRVLFSALPALHCLYIQQPGPRQVPLREAVVSFITFRRLSGNPIAVKYEQSLHMNELSGAGTKHTQCHRHSSLTRFQ